MAKSDLFKRLFADNVEEHTELSDYISSGVDKIISDKVDPYYTLVKTKIQDYYLWSDTKVNQEYKTKMLQRLNQMYFNLSESYLFEKHFVEICIDYVKKTNTAISKSALHYLNDMNKRILK